MLVMGASFAVSILFEAPFAALEKLMFANLHKPAVQAEVVHVSPANDSANEQLPKYSRNLTTDL